ncbi:MAG: hypothetical protein RLZZ598_627 [Pseudomonadota bacterium]|jgi:hypothetical protein
MNSFPSYSNSQQDAPIGWAAPTIPMGWKARFAPLRYSTAFTIASTTFLASPKTIIVLSM